MNTSDPLLLHAPTVYDQPKLKSLPLREQPAYRVSQNAAACNLTELMAAVIGGAKQIEIAQDLLARFDGDIHRLFRAHPAVADGRVESFSIASQCGMLRYMGPRDR